MPTTPSTLDAPIVQAPPSQTYPYCINPNPRDITPAQYEQAMRVCMCRPSTHTSFLTNGTLPGTYMRDMLSVNMVDTTKNFWANVPQSPDVANLPPRIAKLLEISPRYTTDKNFVDIIGTIVGVDLYPMIQAQNGNMSPPLGTVMVCTNSSICGTDDIPVEVPVGIFQSVGRNVCGFRGTGSSTITVCRYSEGMTCRRAAFRAPTDEQLEQFIIAIAHQSTRQ